MKAWDESGGWSSGAKTRTQAAIFESIEKEWSDRMEHDNLPPIRLLDEAARAAGWSNWSNVFPRRALTFRASLIAHARTLHAMEGLKEELAQFKPEPVDPDAAAFAAIIKAWGMDGNAKRILDGNLDAEDRAALAEFKRVKGGVS